MAARAPVAAEAGGGDVHVPIWDLPVRVAHWVLALLVATSWFTGKYGYLAWHRWSGYGVLGLVLFRVYWGFAGGSTARFSHFLRGPGAVWRYSKTLFKRLGSGTAGHNPIGGWSIMAMLILLLLQSGFGLFAVDVDGIESGPLADLVSFDTGRRFASWHATVVNILLFFIALHLAAILHYWLYKRENLVPAMLTGVKRVAPETAASVSFVKIRRALLGLVAIGLLLAAIVTRLRF